MNSAPNQLPPDLLAAGRELQVNPQAAESRLRVILRARPGDATASLMLGAALRAQGKAEEAVQWLGTLVRSSPAWPAVRYQYGLALEAAGRRHEALACLLEARSAAAELPGLNRAIGNLHRALGDLPSAELALTAYVSVPPREPALLEAKAAMEAGDWFEAEAILRPFLADHANDPWALMMLADVALACSKWSAATGFYAQVLELLPRWARARCGQASALTRELRFDEALAVLAALLQEQPEHVEALGLKAMALSLTGDFQAARDCYVRMLELQPDNAVSWLCLGNMQRTLGERAACIASYRRSIELRVVYGEGWWSLANLKNYTFSDEEVAAMLTAIDRSEATLVDRVHLQFALGKANEDRGEHEEAYRRYANASALWRQGMPSESAKYESYTRRSREVLSAGFFADRKGWGAAAGDPVFIVGMPRSGSTLVEQILASHPAIEGTMELLEVLSTVGRLCGNERGLDTEAYPGLLSGLAAGDLLRLGEDYLAHTRTYRRHGTPLFIDKMPNNFLHCGLIHLMLPNARIIDVRRHPMACGWSNFKQHFARGQLFSYDMAEMGAYYREYVRLMAHFDRVLPGRIHRVHYESLVADPEAEIRRMLDYCGLPFDAACMKFHESKRAVWTPSSQQVRQPIYSSELEAWREYEPWLGPLRDALGDVLDAYPAVPASAGY